MKSYNANKSIACATVLMRHMRQIVLSGLVVLVSVSARMGWCGTPWLQGETDRDPVGYGIGEKMTFTVVARDLPELPSGWHAVWERTGDDGKTAALLSRKVVCFLGVYGIDAKRKSLFAELRRKDVRLVFAHASGRTGGGECLAGDPGITVAERPGGITAQMFHDLVVAAGGYAPAPAGALQLDMNGDFIAIHCLATGRYDFKLPRPCRVRNLKSGRWEKTAGDVLPLDLNGRESCWFELH